VVAFIPTEDERPSWLRCQADEAHRWSSIQFYRVGERIRRRMEAGDGRRGRREQAGQVLEGPVRQPAGRQPRADQAPAKAGDTGGNEADPPDGMPCLRMSELSAVASHEQRMGRIVTTDVQPITVAEIVKVYGVTKGNLYVIAHRRKWHRIRHDGRVYYDRTEVDQALGHD
jgi:hypothetical protein